MTALGDGTEGRRQHQDGKSDDSASGQSPASRHVMRGVRLAGGLIVILSLLYLADRFIDAGVWTLALTRGPSLIVAIVIGGAGYGVSSILLAIAWVRILRWCGDRDAPLKAGLGLYARTQIAKYLPGNVFHFVGRHVLGRRLGFDHVALVWAALTETAGMVSVAAGLAIIGGAIWLPVDAGLSYATLVLGALLALLSPFALSWGLERIGPVVGVSIRRRGLWDVAARLQPIFLLYAPFFIISACILWSMAAVIGDASPQLLPSFVPILAAAWLAGYVTPGAAAGLGVREAVLTAALAGLIGPADAVLTAIAYRGVTLAGDAVFFALGAVFSIGGGRT